MSLLFNRDRTVFFQSSTEQVQERYTGNRMASVYTESIRRIYRLVKRDLEKDPSPVDDDLARWSRPLPAKEKEFYGRFKEGRSVSGKSSEKTD
ncbi:MAG: hypothetical protein CR981_00400 [Proteobacteria bacterium]|nr:MAG: hypothetical protein CR981_00400 [Pseudomonadota bacterium]